MVLQKELLNEYEAILFQEELKKMILGRYLGFKIFQGRIKKDDFAGVLNRVNSKLSSWKGRLLNKPGRLTLANVVLTSIPSYGMQIQWFPQSVSNQLDKTVRNFIWKGYSER